MSQNELIESVTRLSASSRFMSTALGETAPILWNSAERAGTVARIDAHFAIAVGLTRPELSYVLDSFDVQRGIELQRSGHYDTAERVLGEYDTYCGNELGSAS